MPGPGRSGLDTTVDTEYGNATKNQTNMTQAKKKQRDSVVTNRRKHGRREQRTKITMHVLIKCSPLPQMEQLKNTAVHCNKSIPCSTTTIKKQMAHTRYRPCALQRVDSNKLLCVFLMGGMISRTQKKTRQLSGYNFVLDTSLVRRREAHAHYTILGINVLASIGKLQGGLRSTYTRVYTRYN